MLMTQRSEHENSSKATVNTQWWKIGYLVNSMITNNFKQCKKFINCKRMVCKIGSGNTFLKKYHRA